jgi:hypothetical protein
MAVPMANRTKRYRTMVAYAAGSGLADDHDDRVDDNGHVDGYVNAECPQRTLPMIALWGRHTKQGTSCAQATLSHWRFRAQ